MIKDSEFILRALDRYRRGYDAVKNNYTDAVKDLRFLYEENAQWETEQIETRKKMGQPTLQNNVLKKYSKQICGEGRRNRTRIKVRPVTSDASVDIANIRAGIIYNIEYQSNAESIYDYARKMVVDCGYGAWRILTRPTKKNPFNYEIYMQRIKNPFTVILDPDSQDPNYADAKYGFLTTVMTREEFKEKYPNAQSVGVGIDGKFAGDVGMVNEGWYDRDMIAVREYFYTEIKKTNMAQLSDGRVMEAKKAGAEIAQWRQTYETAKVNESQNAIGEDREPQPTDETQIPTIVHETILESKKLKWCRMTASEVLEKKDWAGEYIPIVVVTGDETNIAGKDYITGMFRDAKDPQRMLNYYDSAAAETIALAPKAPYMGTPAMFKGFEAEYSRAHKENLPFMLYNADPKAPGLQPQRVQPPIPPVALFQQIALKEEAIKSAIGMFNADVGDVGRELSGTAIEARQAPGDTASFIFLDNMNKGIAHSGRIINDLIPKIYDTDRDARIHNIDDSETFAPINTTVNRAIKKINENPTMFSGMNTEKLQQTVSEGKGQEIFNDLTIGEYDVAISTGPSFQTQRQEAAANIVKLATASAGISPLYQILLFYTVQNMDFDGAPELSDAIRKTLPPGILPPKPGEKPPTPPPPSPQEQMAMETQKIKLQTEMLNRQLQIEKMKVEAERRKTEQLEQRVEFMRLINESADGNTKRQAQKMLDQLECQMNNTAIQTKGV